MSSPRTCITLLVLFLLLVSPCFLSAATFTVRQDGTGDYTEILQAAVAAAPGDTIAVGPGTYSSQMNINKSLTFIGTSGSSATFLDGLNSVNLFNFSGSIDIVLKGFTLERATFGAGSALTANDGANVYVEDCIFQDNYASGGGAAVYSRLAGTHLHLHNCVIRNNHGDNSGAAAAVMGSHLTFTDCIIEENSSGNYGGAVLNDGSTLDISNCLIRANSASNYAGAIFFYYNAGGTVENNTFYANVGGIGTNNETIRVWDSYSTSITNNIFRGTGTGYGLRYIDYVDYHGCNVFWNYTDAIYGVALNPSEIFADPEFCAPMSGNFLLSESSPAAPANNTCGVLFGAYRVGCGPVAVEETTWGRIKSMYAD